MFVGLDLRNVGPGSAEKIAAQLEADVKAGALGVGEIMKSFGLAIKKADGTRLKLDDPELDSGVGKGGGPQDPGVHPRRRSGRVLSADRLQQRTLAGAGALPGSPLSGSVAFSGVRRADGRARPALRKHPETTWVLAHFGWHAQRSRRASASMFDQMPNLYSEVGAVLYDIGRQPRTAHDFFVKYQDRILFGKDSYQPDEYPYYWRVFETNDEYFDYYRDYHAFWKMYGIGLPDQVLKKVYYQNAMRIAPGIAEGRRFRPAQLTATLWLLISSPAARASSDPTSPKSSSGAATMSASSTA